MDGEMNQPDLLATVRAVVVQAFQAKARELFADEEDDDWMDDWMDDALLKSRVHQGLREVFGPLIWLKIYTGFFFGKPSVTAFVADKCPITYVGEMRAAKSLKEAAAMEVASWLKNPSQVSCLQIPDTLHPDVLQFL